MALKRACCLLWAISIAILTILGRTKAHKPINMNVIDRCWRTNPSWRRNRHQLATCSVGYSGKMTNNIGRAVTNYKVTDPSDDPLNPRPGTLRHAMTSVRGKVWVTFARDMSIKLARPLLVSSYTTLDGRGVDVHIAHGACLYLQRDGLIDVTRGSTGITISNNRFKLQNKVMLLGHDDGFRRDKSMRVTVAFNHFGPHCQQRMPRLRFGYAHVVNNLYLGWGQYALGGSMNPGIKSQANLFIAPQGDNKEITWDSSANGRFKSINDVLENGASFKESADKGLTMRPNYRPDQNFEVADGRMVRALTSSAGALICPRISTC
ncbi:Probable pectate lyase 4 [Striga hermonthica]|uniref:Pectate lyase n=1 Tax=Striga hermonthica TaxID=68872 RepID=A0A9N7N2U8_STRHE|nr:Probable pectate lyase 4 [Striga hermonthica]